MSTNWQMHSHGQQLAQRLASLCTGHNRRAVRSEALALVDWALAALDWRLVDGIIGTAETHAVKPTLPRALVDTFRMAAANAGIHLAPFDPDRKPQAAAKPAPPPRHPRSCVCQGTGWVDTDEPLIVRRCPGRRVTLTVTPMANNGSEW